MIRYSVVADEQLTLHVHSCGASLFSTKSFSNVACDVHASKAMIQVGNGKRTSVSSLFQWSLCLSVIISSRSGRER